MATIDEKPISLSQAVLAPLNSIFKAQLHAARSFLGMLLELGYQKKAEDEGRRAGDREPWLLAFRHAGGVVEVPALALVPIAPLGVESAQFGFELEIEEIAEHSQSTVGNRRVEPKSKQPHKEWYLVPEPVSLRGRLGTAEAPTQQRRARSSAIRLEVKVGQLKKPAGLDRLLTSLTESSQQTLPSGGQ